MRCDQVLVGACALADEDLETRQHGDEFACLGLQSETHDANDCCSASDGGYEVTREE